MLLFIGSKLTKTWPALMDYLRPIWRRSCEAEVATRKIIWIGVGKGEAPAGALEIAATPAALPNITRELLEPSCWAARRRKAPALTKKLTEVADILKAAHFGVAVWSADTVDALSIEMLTGLVIDLNKNTRFSCVRSVPPMNAAASCSPRAG